MSLSNLKPNNNLTQQIFGNNWSFATDKLFEFNSVVLAGMNKNTRKSLETGIKLYTKFCASVNLTPFSDDIEISKQAIHQYINHLVETGCTQSTLKNRLAAVSRIFRIIEVRNPLLESEVTREYVKQSVIKLKSARQVMPLKHELLAKIPEVSANSTLVEIRNAMIYFLGIYTLCRASELLAIEVNDIDLVTNTVLIKRAKNDQTGVGRFANISPKTANIVKLYLDRSQITSGRVIRAISRGGNVRSEVYLYGDKKGQVREVMSYEGLLHIITQESRKLITHQNSHSTIGSHSLRVGSAVSMAELGVEITQIAQAGGWQNLKMVLLYTRQANAKKIGTAHFVD